MQAFNRHMSVLAVFRVLRLTGIFKVFKVNRKSFELITATFADSITTLNTIVFLILLTGIILSALVFAAEAVVLDPLTHVRPRCSSFCHHDSYQSMQYSIMDIVME
jgi:hypothetical protein